MKISRPPWPDLLAGMRPRAGRIPVKDVLRSCLELLFPPLCLACGALLDTAKPPLLCSACRARIRPLVSPLCCCCGTPFPTGRNHLCGACLRKPPPFARARSAYFYQEPLAGLILAMKYSHRLTALGTLSYLALQSKALAGPGRIDLVLPVPLHPDRLRERGYNQALLLARECFGDTRVPIAANVLQKDRPTPPQMSLSASARRANLRGVFSVVRPESVRGRNILLVDDVFTTGSTAAACSQVLNQAGAARVEVFTLARAL